MRSPSVRVLSHHVSFFASEDLIMELLLGPQMRNHVLARWRSDVSRCVQRCGAFSSVHGSAAYEDREHSNPTPGKFLSMGHLFSSPGYFTCDSCEQSVVVVVLSSMPSSNCPSCGFLSEVCCESLEGYR